MKNRAAPAEAGRVVDEVKLARRKAVARRLAERVEHGAGDAVQKSELAAIAGQRRLTLSALQALGRAGQAQAQET